MGANRAQLLQEFNLDIPPTAPIVTFAGKMSRTKGIDTLMLTNRRIQKKQPVHFIIFGSGEREDVLDGKLREAYEFANMHFLGHRPYQTVACFHNISRFSVMPSRSEGFLHLVNLPNTEYDVLSQRALDAARSFSWTAIAEQRVTYYEEITRRKIGR